MYDSRFKKSFISTLYNFVIIKYMCDTSSHNGNVCSQCKSRLKKNHRTSYSIAYIFFIMMHLKYIGMYLLLSPFSWCLYFCTCCCIFSTSTIYPFQVKECIFRPTSGTKQNCSLFEQLHWARPNT